MKFIKSYPIFSNKKTGHPSYSYKVYTENLYFDDLKLLQYLAIKQILENDNIILKKYFFIPPYFFPQNLINLSSCFIYKHIVI